MTSRQLKIGLNLVYFDEEFIFNKDDKIITRNNGKNYFDGSVLTKFFNITEYPTKVTLHDENKILVLDENLPRIKKLKTDSDVGKSVSCKKGFYYINFKNINEKSALLDDYKLPDEDKFLNKVLFLTSDNSYHIFFYINTDLTGVEIIDKCIKEEIDDSVKENIRKSVSIKKWTEPDKTTIVSKRVPSSIVRESKKKKKLAKYHIYSIDIQKLSKDEKKFIQLPDTTKIPKLGGPQEEQHTEQAKSPDAPEEEEVIVYADPEGA